MCQHTSHYRLFLLSHVLQLLIPVERCHIVAYYFAILAEREKNNDEREFRVLLSVFHPINSLSSSPTAQPLILGFLPRRCFALNNVRRVPLYDQQDRKKEREKTERRKTKVCTAPDVRVSLHECSSSVALDTSLPFLD